MGKASSADTAARIESGTFEISRSNAGKGSVEIKRLQDAVSPLAIRSVDVCGSILVTHLPNRRSGTFCASAWKISPYPPLAG